MQVTSVGGTSCASPIFASFIALVNDRLIAAGKPVLGFLNPLLYGAGRDGLDDVTTGMCSRIQWEGHTSHCDVILRASPRMFGVHEVRKLFIPIHECTG